MSGPWRITVDSWISEDADWHGCWTYVIDGFEAESMREALLLVANSEPADYMRADYHETRSGRAPEPDFPPPEEDVDG